MEKKDGNHSTPVPSNISKLTDKDLKSHSHVSKATTHSQETHGKHHEIPDCINGHPPHDPCFEPPVTRSDPKYMTSPKVHPECQEQVPLEPFEDVVRKRAFMKERLLKEVEDQRLHPIDPNEAEKKSSVFEMREYYENHPETTRSLDFLKANPEFQVAGPNPMRVPHDELIKAMDGFTNMQLAHEICINHDFRLERHKPEETSMEGRVRTVMKQAYWDTFEEALTSTPPNYNQAIGVFREMKEMLLNLLLPHNQGMRQRIETGLHEGGILEEVRLEILDFHKYSDFIIDTLGQLCCPMRDRQVFALKSLEKPSDIFRQILELMEEMQMDMANFLIGQFRKTIITNCVEYERLKFADFIDLEYKLREDALRVTRSWLLRHRIADRHPSEVVGRAFGEVLLWNEKEWPETLTLDWTRYTGMAEEAQRISYIGAAIHSCYNAVKGIFDDEDEFGMIKRHIKVARSKGVRAKMEVDADILLRKEDMVDEKKRTEALELVAAQAIKITKEAVQAEFNREMTASERETVRRAIVDSGRPENTVRPLLIRRMQEYAAQRITTIGNSSVDFPKSLLPVQTAVLTVLVELHRIAMHNRAVFYDLYKAIIEDEISRPVFMNENEGKRDPMVQKTIDILRATASKKLVVVQDAKNEKLEETLDEHGKHIVELEDGPVVETTPEIEAIIDKIMAETEFVDDYDEFANVGERGAVKLLHQLNRHDSAYILRQMEKEEESLNRILEKKRKMREELRINLKVKMGLPIFHKVLNKEEKIHTYCKLLKCDAKEESEKKLKEANLQQPPVKNSESGKPQKDNSQSKSPGAEKS